MIILDGKKLAELQEKEMKQEMQELHQKQIIPGLAVILVGDDPASQAYVNMKAKASQRVGINSITQHYHQNISEDVLLEAIKRLNEDRSVDGILIQLPLPQHINTQAVLEAIDPKKDVDGFHPYNIGRMQVGLDTFLSATPMGIMELLDAYKIEVKGKDVVVIGASNIVGKPLASLMLQRGASVSICHIYTKDITFYTKNADIVCVGVGKPALLKKEMIKKDAIVIDIGINRLENGQIVGDVEEGIQEICSYITPVPGGVGPMTISSLLKNTIKAAKKNKGLYV